MSFTDNSSRSSSHRRRHHHSPSESDSSSVVSKSNFRSFQPVPSIEKQLKLLEGHFNRVQSSMDTATVTREFLPSASKFHDALSKILIDLIKVFTNSFRRGQVSLEDVKEIIDSTNSSMNSINNFFLAFRKLQVNYLARFTEDVNSLQILVEFWGFVEDNYAMFLNEFWRFCLEINNQTGSIPEFYETYEQEVRTFGNYVTDHHNHLNELHLKFIRTIKEIDLAKDIDYEEEEEEEDYDDEDDPNRITEKNLRLKIGDAIRGAYLIMYPTLKDCWEIEFLRQLDEVKRIKKSRQNQEEQQEEEDENEIQLNLFIYDLFDNRLTQIEQLYKIAIQLDTDQGPPKLIRFIKEEAGKSFADQLNNLKKLWHYASTVASYKYSSAEMAHFGYVIKYHLKSEVRYNPTPQTLSKIADYFMQAEQLNDLQTAQKLIKLLSSELNKKITSLEEMYKQETQMLNEPPQYEYCEDFRFKHQKLSDNINNLALQIAESIKVGQAAAFFHKKNDPSFIYDEELINPDDDDVFMRTEIFELLKINPLFNDKIYEHIKELKTELNAAYENIMIEASINENSSMRSGRSGSNYNDYSSTKSFKEEAKNKSNQKMINDTLSMYSNKAKSISYQVNSFDDVSKKIEFRTQIELIEESICRTYEHIFASTRTLLISQLRLLHDEKVENINKQLKTLFNYYIRHLEVLKKWYIQEMKVDLVKSVEARMEKFQGVSSKILDDCLKESFQDFLEQIVENYLRNVEEAKDVYEEKMDNLKSEMVSRMDIMASDVHIKQLEIIEQKYRIELKQEKERDSPAITESEDRIRTMLASKQYELAKREQEKLAKLRVDEWDRKKKEIKKKYDEIRKKKLDQQARDLKVLEDSFDSKTKKIQRFYEDELKEQNKMLFSAITNGKLLHVRLWKKVNSMNAPPSSNTSPVKSPIHSPKRAQGESPQKNSTLKEFDDITKRILRDHDIDEVPLATKEKLPDFFSKPRTYRL